MKQYILIDIDNTLSASWRRADLIDIEGWDAFHADCINDEPIQDMADLVRALKNSPKIIIGFTERNKKFWSVTATWLLDNNIPLHEVWMRDNTDFRPSAEAKLDMATAFFGGVEFIKENVLVVIDDDEKVLEAFAALGITVLHCMPSRG